MTHPLLVEAIEDHFVPMLVFNNKPGTDAQLLKKYNEPSWNNPVIRYLDSADKDLVPRKELVLSVAETAQRMTLALEGAKREVPDFLRAVAAPSRGGEMETATFAMYCYWEGEAQLGAIDGVYSTRSAWRDGLEVVVLRYHPEEVSYKTLVEKAITFKCASKIFAHSKAQLETAKSVAGERVVYAKDPSNIRMAKGSDQRYYLNNSPLKYLPLCELQKTKVNASLRRQDDLTRHLSPRQQKLAARIVNTMKNNRRAFDDLQVPSDQNQLGEFLEQLNKKLAVR